VKANLLIALLLASALGACPTIQESPGPSTTSCGQNVLAALHAASKGISRTGS